MQRRTIAQAQTVLHLHFKSVSASYMQEVIEHGVRTLSPRERACNPMLKPILDLTTK